MIHLIYYKKISEKKYNTNLSGLPIFSEMPTAITDWLDIMPTITGIEIVGDNKAYSLTPTSDYLEILQKNNRFQIYTKQKSLNITEKKKYYLKIATNFGYFVSDIFVYCKKI